MRKQLFLGLVGLLFSLLCFSYIQANDIDPSFTIDKIDIQGLQGLSEENVKSYLPVKKGDRVDDEISKKIIQDLYHTGFFDNVSLLRDGNTLIIRVAQRPVITKIKISGNKEIPTDKLKEVLKTLHFSEGEVFNEALLERIKSSLKQEYLALGKYNASVKVTATLEDKKRMTIEIQISEGAVATIKQIKILGNNAFSEKTLVSEFKLSTTGLFSFYTHDDQYSKEKLNADVETLRSYYLDRGYLNFHINSTQVSITPDHKDVYITLSITEGGQYKISGYAFMGELILPLAKLKELTHIEKNEIFSRKAILESNENIIKALANKGYANANIDIQPKINEEDKTVFVNLVVHPGQRVYVRRITFSGNYRTNDKTLRREFVQAEGALLSSNRIEDSKRFLLLLPYIRDVDVQTKPVPGKKDAVDLQVKVNEQSAAGIKGGIGYSQLNKIMLTASLDHKNIFGTGNQLSINAMKSLPSFVFGISYYNPYYTQSGIGRSIDIYTNQFDSGKVNISNYNVSTYGGSVGYDFRIAKNTRVNFGYGYENDFVDIGNTPSKELTNFANKYSRTFYQIMLNTGLSYNGFDRRIFPTRGFMHSIYGQLAAPMGKQSLQYYKLGLSEKYYRPLFSNFIFQTGLNVNYGDGYGRYDTLPFFKNFYAGGVGSVRGFAGNSLGPKDSRGNSIGGRFETDGNLGLIFPNPFTRNLRTTWFFDFGNVYEKLELSGLRCSTGLQLDWLSPIGILNFTLAKVISKRAGDDQEIFAFNVGTSF